jgi:hypothetical protein
MVLSFFLVLMFGRPWLIVEYARLYSNLPFCLISLKTITTYSRESIGHKMRVSFISAKGGLWSSENILHLLGLDLKNFQSIWRMVSSGMSRHVALVRTDVSEELGASIIMVTRTDELGTMLAVTSNRRTLRRNTCHPDEGRARFLRNDGSYKSHTA